MVRVGGDLSLTLPNDLIWGREEEEKWEGQKKVAYLTQAQAKLNKTVKMSKVGWV